MKQPAAILVLPVMYTILVLPVFYQNLPVSAILVQILVNTSFPVSSRIFRFLQLFMGWMGGGGMGCRFTHLRYSMYFFEQEIPINTEFPSVIIY